MRIYIVISFFVVSLNNLQALDSIVWKTVDTGKNLSISYVTDMQYDLSGKLWIATQDGLFQYDGYNIKKYTANPNEKYGLVKNTVLKIHLSKDGSLWFAAPYSIYRYNERMDDLERMTEDLRHNFDELYKVVFFDIEDIDDKHKLLATKAGAWIYHVPTKKAIKYLPLVDKLYHDPYSTNAHIFEISQDVEDQNLLWLLTKKGLVTYHKKERLFANIPHPSSINFSELNDRGYNLINNPEEVIMLIDHLNIYGYHKKTKKWRTISVQESHEQKKHVRNLLPFKNGFLVVFIESFPIYYNFQTGEKTEINCSFPDLQLKKGYSQLSYDHNGRLVYIENNQKLMKSSSSFFTPRNEHEIFSKNLYVENVLVPDTLKKMETLNLPSYQRTIQFEVGLTNRKEDEPEHFYYKLNGDEQWIEAPERIIKLEGLDYGYQEVLVKVLMGEKEYISSLKRIYIQPYFYETWWFLTLLFLSGIGLASTFIYLWNVRKKDKKFYEQQLLSLEMNTLRSQMNPHFLFNSLNSIKNYVVSKSKDEAAEYLTDFSRLIRMILENSRKTFLTIEDEIKMLKLYIDMECRRLNYSYTYEIKVSPDVNPDFMIPPLLLQPYVENAIWHGLMNKYGEKHLNINISPTSDGIKCIIYDNGIGREASEKLKKDHKNSKKSLAMKITGDRFEIFNQMYAINTTSEIIDHKNEHGESLGTEVIINLPFIEEVNHYGNHRAPSKSIFRRFINYIK